MTDFDFAIDFVFAVEGYISNHKADAGGYTKYGIAQKSHPNIIVKNLTLDGAKAIYQKEYWLACRCNEMPRNVGLYVMDFAVNSGTATAAKALQRCVNFLTSGKNDAPLVVDGKIGQKTIEAVQKVDPNALTAALHAHRSTFFINLVKKNSTQRVFLNGWMNRLAKLNLYANGVPVKLFGAFV